MKTDMVKLVTFRLGADLFAADIAFVEVVLRYAAPSAVPDVPDWIEGVIEHRGQVIPVVDMRRRIGLGDWAVTPETRTLVLVTPEGRVGAIVDSVLEVAVLPATNVSAPPPLFRGLASTFLRGVARVREQLVVVLDVDRVLSTTERLQFAHAVDAVESANGVHAGDAMRSVAAVARG